MAYNVRQFVHDATKKVAMEAFPWFWVWIALAAILCVGEMFTLSFFMLPFAIGAAVTAVANAFGANVAVQWVVFVLVSLVALAAMRPVANRITNPVTAPTGAERLVGSVGEVIAGKAPGGLVRVRVEREEWNANIEDGSELDIGAKVKVVALAGTRLTVIAADDEDKGTAF